MFFCHMSTLRWKRRYFHWLKVLSRVYNCNDQSYLYDIIVCMKYLSLKSLGTNHYCYTCKVEKFKMQKNEILVLIQSALCSLWRTCLNVQSLPRVNRHVSFIVTKDSGHSLAFILKTFSDTKKPFHIKITKYYQVWREELWFEIRANDFQGQICSFWMLLMQANRFCDIHEYHQEFCFILKIIMGYN